MIALPSRSTIGWALVKFGGAVLVLVLAWAFIHWAIPKRDAAPAIETARKDERAAATASTQVGTQAEAQNRDTNIHLDFTTKEIRDAFDAPQPVPSAPAGGAALPPAPVDRMRDRLNESIARANRAADAAGNAE